MQLAGRAGAEARWGLSQNDKPYTQHNTQAIIAKDLGLSTGTVIAAHLLRVSKLFTFISVYFS